MTTPSQTPCSKCEEYKEAFADLLEMTNVDPEDTDELDEPDTIVVKIATKILRQTNLLDECYQYLSSMPEYCKDLECKKPLCLLGNKILNNIAGEEE